MRHKINNYLITNFVAILHLHFFTNKLKNFWRIKYKIYNYIQSTSYSFEYVINEISEIV